MKAVLITYKGEAIESRKIVEISDDHKWEDGPYVDTIPFSVGSNQTVVDYEYYEDWMHEVFISLFQADRLAEDYDYDELTELFKAGLSPGGAVEAL